MSKNLYIATTEPRGGKSAVALGVMELLVRTIGNVGFFRPIVNIDETNKVDKDIHLIASNYGLKDDYNDMYAYTFTEAHELISTGRQDQIYEKVLNKYKQIEAKYDFVLCEGTDYQGVTSAFEFDINVDLANNLGTPVLIVTNAYKKNIDGAVNSVRIAVEAFEEKGCSILATVVNRVPPELIEGLKENIERNLSHIKHPIYNIPERYILGSPNIEEVARHTNAKVIYGKNQLSRYVQNYVVAAMQLRNFLDYLKDGSLVITPGDRADIILGCILSRSSNNTPNISGLLLTGGLVPEESIYKLIAGLPAFPLAILSAQEDTFNTAIRAASTPGEITPESADKITAALSLFEASVNTDELREQIAISHPTRVTPKMFEYELIQKARANKQRIVLPEGEDERILKAADILTKRDVVKVTLLGNRELIDLEKAKLDLPLEGVEIVDPAESPYLEDYAQSYYEFRKHKGVTPELARETMMDVTYFGTMMVHKGHADGMVSGAVHTTGHTIRPAFEFVRTKPGYTIVSSVFLMCLEDRVIVYGDCAVNPTPTAEQLAQIAIASAETARIFGIEPRVAMLSYSTGSSGKGAEVEKVQKATEIAQQKRPELLLEGPMQYDAAVDANVAKTKMPDSKVAGVATVFIFPDLNTGNNTYKAVQRSANAVAIGPILQGLNKPVNDLSRGCTIPDIVNTVAITAVQAQAEKNS